MFYNLFHATQGSFPRQPIVTWLSLKSAQNTIDTLNYSTVHNPRVHIEPFKLNCGLYFPKYKGMHDLQMACYAFYITKHTFQQLIRIEC